jgi:hypothetical protein
MTRKELIQRMFRDIDTRNAAAFVSYLSDDARFRFGNAEAVCGKNSVADMVGSFFQSIKALQHEVLEQWEQDNVVICHGRVTYTRMDSSSLTVPYAVILKFKAEMISEYYIFSDLSELYQTS